MVEIGKKIAIVGVSASGKSTFAKKLAEKTRLPLTHIDAIMWKPGWNFTGKEETAAKLDEISSRTEWIIEGYLVEPARPIVLERADAIIFLEYHPFIASWRYFKRWWKHRKNPRPELEGSPEKFSFKFLELAWTKAEVSHIKEIVQKPEYKNKIIWLHSLKQTTEFLQEL